MFEGKIENSECTVRFGGSLLDPRLDIANKSPSGFAWGFGGSGPAQLALAMCCAVVGDDNAQAIYQDFKRQFVATLDQGKPWSLSVDEAKEIMSPLLEAAGIPLDDKREASGSDSDDAPVRLWF